jgi:sugar O-acyltransferase (sialic acid O-acetyltransferase NeuD family)
MLTELTLLGKSDATVAMVIDTLVDLNFNSKVLRVVNNLNLPIEKEFSHPRFKIELIEQLSNREGWFVLGVTKPNAKKAIVKEFNGDELKWIKLEHPTTSVSSTTSTGKAFSIGPLSVISAYTKIGDFVTINRGVTIGHHVVIENYVTINPGVNIAGNVIIGEGTMVGIGANIIDGVKIGKNSIIGAGSIVTKDIPDGVVAYGNPCKVIRTV